VAGVSRRSSDAEKIRGIQGRPASRGPGPPPRVHREGLTFGARPYTSVRQSAFLSDTQVGGVAEGSTVTFQVIGQPFRMIDPGLS